MTELDQMWDMMLTRAREAAGSSRRSDVLDYLDLRVRNDALRRTGVEWITTAIFEVTAGPEFALITIDREEPHNFQYRGANLSGSLLKLRQGVRCLTIEAGWTRVPGDGFMRGGALAVARFTHFGRKEHGNEIILKQKDDGPVWVVNNENDTGSAIDSSFIARHIQILIEEP